jgi:hypothetical protein
VGSEVGEVTEATGCDFEFLDGAVDSFGEGVGDAAREVVEQAVEMGLEGRGDFPHGGELTLSDESIPDVKFSLGFGPVSAGS